MKVSHRKTNKVGGGARFAKLKTKLSARKGVKNPRALAAVIGREKYGKKKFAQMAARGRRRRGR